MELYAIICDITYMSEFTLDILLFKLIIKCQGSAH